MEVKVGVKVPEGTTVGVMVGVLDMTGVLVGTGVDVASGPLGGFVGLMVGHCCGEAEHL